MVVVILLALLNAFTPWHDWYVIRDRRNYDGCKVTVYEWWRFQKPWTGGSIHIADVATKKQCDIELRR